MKRFWLFVLFGIIFVLSGCGKYGIPTATTTQSVSSGGGTLSSGSVYRRNDRSRVRYRGNFFNYDTERRRQQIDSTVQNGIRNGTYAGPDLGIVDKGGHWHESESYRERVIKRETETRYEKKSTSYLPPSDYREFHPDPKPYRDPFRSKKPAASVEIKYDGCVRVTVLGKRSVPCD